MDANVDIDADIDVDADVDRTDNAGKGIADVDKAADNLVEAQQTQTKQTRYRQETSHRRYRRSIDTADKP